jgi:superfamily I DNA/RNA helicase
MEMVQDGVLPEDILMVTFSEKARAEMAQRIRMFAAGQMMAQADIEGIEKVGIETFNSWGQKMLNEHFALLGFSSQPVLVDDVQKKDIILGILDRNRGLPLDYRNPFLNLPSASGAAIQLGKWLDALKAAHAETVSDVAAVLGRAVLGHESTILSIYQEYNQILLEANLIDYEDQLRLLLQLGNHGVFEKMNYRHIVVDEFQDSNPNQIAILVEVARRSKQLKSLAVVGDELQAIYGFRNASPENLVSFGDHFPDMKDIDLTANFRSQAPIIAAANKIVSRVSKLQKVIEAHKKSSSVQPVLREIQTPEDELKLFGAQVEKLIRNGHEPSSIAVICRT